MSMKYFVMLSWILAFRKVWAASNEFDFQDGDDDGYDDDGDDDDDVDDGDDDDNNDVDDEEQNPPSMIS